MFHRLIKFAEKLNVILHYIVVEKPNMRVHVTVIIREYISIQTQNNIELYHL